MARLGWLFVLAIPVTAWSVWWLNRPAPVDPFAGASDLALERAFERIEDPSPMERRRAAVALAARGDAHARPELRAMLRAWTVFAPWDGRVQYRLQAGQRVSPGLAIARIGAEELKAPLPGRILVVYEPHDAEVRAGQRLLDLAPDPGQVAEALRALAKVGERFDLDDVERYARGVPGMPPEVQRQAVLTHRALAQ